VIDAKRLWKADGPASDTAWPNDGGAAADEASGESKNADLVFSDIFAGYVKRMRFASE
jgi:hypothetical protein